MGFIVPGNTQPLQPAPLSSNQRIPDMGVAQGTNPLYTQQQPQQPQDTGRWQRAQQLFNTPGYTNDPGFGGSAADQAKARQQNQQIAQNMFPQIYGNNGYGPTQGSGGQNSWQGNFDLPPGQLSGWMGDPGSNTPNYSTTNQNPFINSLGMNGIPLNSSQNNTYGTGGGQGPKGFAQWQGWGQNNLPPGQNFQPFQVSGNQGQIRGGFPQMNPQIQQILQLLMNYTPQNLQMALANGQFAIPGYTNPTPGKVNPMFMY